MERQASNEVIEIREVTAEEFTGLSSQEIAFIDLKIELSEKIRKLRTAKGWTQTQLAKEIGTSQSRVNGNEFTVDDDAARFFCFHLLLPFAACIAFGRKFFQFLL